MGNRAVITTKENYETNGIGIYMHWNGDIESIQAILAYCKVIGARVPELDDYGWASLARVISNIFGGTMSVGINTCNHLDCDNGDNGTYFIKDWQIIGNTYFDNDTLKKYLVSGDELVKNVLQVNEYQPEDIDEDQIRKELFKD